MKQKKLAEMISNLEDAKLTVEEAREESLSPQHDQGLSEVEETLEAAIDQLEDAD